MRFLAGMLFGLGLILVLSVGTSVALLSGEPEVVTQGAPAIATPQIERPNLPASASEVSRPDLRPSLPEVFDYTPQVGDVATYRMRDGLSLRRFSVFDGGQGAAPRPVVILFHGASRDELSMIDMWDETARAHGLILISLKSNGATWDPGTDDSALLARALATAEADFPIDRAQIFLFGHSAGSIYAQMLANRGDGPWLAVAGHAGTYPARWTATQPVAVPVRHYLGSSDALFEAEHARQSVQALAGAGHYAELVLIPGHTHWFYEGGPAIAEDAWGWFAGMMDDPAG